MKAIQLIDIEKALELRDLPIPAVGEKDVLVRVKAAGICHSDVHYQTGASPVGPLPQTLGHEIAGTIEEIGPRVTNVLVGERVCLHYLVTCGECHFCRTGVEQFCAQVAMLGKDRDGGYAEYVAVPARNVVRLPDEVSLEAGAVLMCSSSTSIHALRKARLQAGETVAIFGAGGLGMSAIQLARAFGALQVYAVDINEDKLDRARGYGAIPIDASHGDPVAEIRRLTGDQGVDVALEVVGLAETMAQAVRALGVLGRAVMVGIASEPLEIDTYRELLAKEAEVIGCSDHALWDLPLLVEFVRQGRLDLSGVVERAIPLEADAVNTAMDQLRQFGGEVRTVIVP